MSFSIYEALMLFAFGASWPLAIIKTYTSKNPAGKSLLFSVLIIAGYLCGIAHKAFYGKWDIVGYLYIVNLLMVAFDLYLVIFYRHFCGKK